jgi:uncharacterized protein
MAVKQMAQAVRMVPQPPRYCGENHLEYLTASTSRRPLHRCATREGLKMEVPMERRTAMKRFLIAAALCLAFVASATAQQPAANSPAAKADVERLLQVMHMHEMMLKMIDTMSRPMHEMIHKQYLEDKEKCELPPDFEVRMNKILDESMKTMPWEQLIQAVVPAYQKHFTEGDIDALIVFYSGPTGQKFLRETPAITAETMQVTMPLMIQHNAALMKRIKEETARMKKESGQKPCPPQSTQKQ